MAFISNWIRGEKRERVREHTPIKVTINWTDPIEGWYTKEQHVVTAINLTRDDGDCLSLLLTDQDLVTLLSKAATLTSTSARVVVAEAALTGINKRALLSVVARFIAPSQAK